MSGDVRADPCPHPLLLPKPGLSQLCALLSALTSHPSISGDIYTHRTKDDLPSQVRIIFCREVPTRRVSQFVSSVGLQPHFFIVKY